MDPLLRLVLLRKEAQDLVKAKLLQGPQEQIQVKVQELAEAHETIQNLYSKVQVQEKVQFENTTQLNDQLAEVHGLLDKTKKEKEALQAANRAMLNELEQSQKSISDLIKDRETVIQKHVQETADLKLKHEQEIFILKKMKR